MIRLWFLILNFVVRGFSGNCKALDGFGSSGDFVLGLISGRFLL